MADPDDLVPPPPQIEGDAARAVPVTVAQMDAARTFLLTISDPDKVTDAAVWRHAANVVLAEVVTAEPGTTDQREATAQWLRDLDIDDTVGTDTVAVFALLRDVADHEPLWPGPGRAGVRCTMCGATTAGQQPPVEHRIWCPWVRVTQIVGTAIACADAATEPDQSSERCAVELRKALEAEADG